MIPFNENDLTHHSDALRYNDVVIHISLFKLCVPIELRYIILKYMCIFATNYTIRNLIKHFNTISIDTSYVTNMRCMFDENFNQPINHWNVSNVTNMSKMFSGAYKFNQSLNNWNLYVGVDLKDMFKYLRYELELCNVYRYYYSFGYVLKFYYSEKTNDKIYTYVTLNCCSIKEVVEKDVVDMRCECRIM